MKHFEKIGLCLLLTLFLGSLFSTFLPRIANAAPGDIQARWVDNFNLEITSGGNHGSDMLGTYQSDDKDANWHFYRVDDPDGCADIINDISWSPSGAGDKTDDPSDDDTTAKYQLRVNTSAGCEDSGDEIDVELSNAANAMNSFTWDGEYIRSTNGDEGHIWTFADDPNDNLTGVYFRVDSSENSCRDSITVASAGAATGTVQIRVTSGFSDPTPGDSGFTSQIMNAGRGFSWISLADYARAVNGCYESENVPVNLQNTQLATAPGTGDTDGQSLGGDTFESSCETSSGALGWILCPIATNLDTVTGFLDQQIEARLQLDEGYFDQGTDSGQGLRNAWLQLRNIAYVILIPLMLIMVIGTALGFEVFSAYTVKRALPRMAVAIIFITLSWYVCLFLVQLTNVAGAGIRGLVTTPFRNVPAAAEGYQGTQSSLGNALVAAGVIQDSNSGAEAQVSTGVSLGLAAAIGAGAISSVVSAGVIVSTLASAALILGIMLLLLAAREMILIGLMLVAPLAILSWIFPGNDKMWKLWWGSFSKLLLLFPVIMLIIGVGQVFALVTGTANSGSGGMNLLVVAVLVVAAYIMPYFFIPFAFKWAGGLFGNLAGMVNNREKGMLDRLSKGRQNMRARNLQNAKNFGRFKGRNALTRRMNDMGGIATNRPNAWGTPSRLRDSRQAGQGARAAEALKNDRVYQANQNDDKFLLALGDRDQAIEHRNASAAKQLDLRKKAQAAMASGDAARAADLNRQADGEAASMSAWDSALGNANLVTSKDHAGTKMAAIQAHAATGYNTAAGQAGYNQLATSITKALGVDEKDVMRDARGNITGVSGKNAGNFAAAMNQAQYNLKGAGRFDLGGINNGAGFDLETGIGKASLYELANGKKQSITGMVSGVSDDLVDARRGYTVIRDANGNSVRQALSASQINKKYEKAAIAEAELKAMLPNSKGAVRDEIVKQQRLLEGSGGADFEAWKSTKVGPATPVQRRVDYDSARAATDPAYAASWTADPDAMARGWRSETRMVQESNKDIADHKARTYERPDPNRMD